MEDKALDIVRTISISPLTSMSLPPTRSWVIIRYTTLQLTKDGSGTPKNPICFTLMGRSCERRVVILFGPDRSPPTTCQTDSADTRRRPIRWKHRILSIGAWLKLGEVVVVQLFRGQLNSAALTQLGLTPGKELFICSVELKSG